MDNELQRFRDAQVEMLIAEGWRAEYAFELGRKARLPDPVKEEVAGVFYVDPETGNFHLADEAMAIALDRSDNISYAAEPRDLDSMTTIDGRTYREVRNEECRENKLNGWRRNFGAVPQNLELFEAAEEIQLRAAMGMIRPELVDELLNDLEWEAW